MLFQLKKIGHFIFDLAGSIVLFLLLPILKLSRKYGVDNFPLQFSLYKRVGIFPIRDHYYEPKFVYEDAFDASLVREIPLYIDIAQQIEQLGFLQNISELNLISAEISSKGFYVHNPNFGAGDAELYYLLIRNKKPRRIIEIGSGYSTQLSILALEKNKAEDANCELTCIEPFEMPFLDSLHGVTVIRKQVERVPLEIFKSLEVNDILFIDSSHIIRPGNDLLFIYFQILPILKKGVLIHIHDIFTPRHYPQEWLTKKMRFWNEQYLLEAFLYNNSEFKISFTLNHLVKTDYSAAKKILIHLKTDSEPSSWWMERR
jgi:predicted O-methyltransferase YrrM